MTEDDDDPAEPAPLEGIPNAADAVSQDRVRQRARKREDERAAFWRSTLAQPIGRQVLWELLREGGLFQVRFGATPAGFPCPEKSWFELGKRDLVERLYDTLLRHDRLAVCLMHDEHDSPWQTPKPQRTSKNG